MQTALRSHEFPSSVADRFQQILPQIRSCALYAFRRQPVAEKEEAVQDVLVQCFFVFHRMLRRGEGTRVFPTVLARYAILRYRSGRRAMGCEPREGLSASAEPGRGASSEPVRRSQRGGWQDSLIEDRRTPVPDQVCFRIDFPEWLQRLPRQDRRLAELFVAGLPATEVAKQLEVTPARVSQIRKALREDWKRYQGELERAAAG